MKEIVKIESNLENVENNENLKNKKNLENFKKENLKKNENPAYNLITNQLAEFSNSLKLITQGFLKLDEKITKNEKRTNNLLEIASVKKEKILRQEEFINNFGNEVPIYCENKNFENENKINFEKIKNLKNENKFEIRNNFENENFKNLENKNNLDNFEDENNPENNLRKYQLKYDINDDYCKTENNHNKNLFTQQNSSNLTKSEKIKKNFSNEKKISNQNLKNFSKIQENNIIPSLSEKADISYFKKNTSSPAPQKLVDLNELENFINSRENISENFENNFSFKKNSEFTDENVFDEVIGKSMKEKTVTFQNDEEFVNNLMCNSFKISKDNKDLIFNTIGNDMKNVDLQYSMRVSSK